MWILSPYVFHWLNEQNCKVRYPTFFSSPAPPCPTSETCLLCLTGPPEKWDIKEGQKVYCNLIFINV